MCAGAVPIMRSRRRRRRAEPSPPRGHVMFIGSVCSNVPEPVVPGLAAPPEPFLLPTEPVRNMSKGRTALIHKPTDIWVMWIYGLLMISVPAPVVAVADAGAVGATSNHPNVWYGNMMRVSI